MVKTEYSTFTYFVTSLNPAGQTVTSTDIIVSSNVVTETIGVEPTPGLSNLVSTELKNKSYHIRKTTVKVLILIYSKMLLLTLCIR